MLGIANVLGEIEAKLQADLPAKVDELNDEFDDGILITAPHATNYLRVFDPKDQSELDGLVLPAVVLRPETEDVVGGPDVGDEYTVRNLVEVAFIVGYDVQASQEARLLRYMRAAKEILGPEDSLDCGGVAYGGGGFARTWTTDNGVLRDVALVFVVTVHETP